MKSILFNLKESFTFADYYCKLLGHQLREYLGTQSYFNIRDADLQVKNG